MGLLDSIIGIVPGIVGGIQSRNASKDAAAAQTKGYQQAATTVNDAVSAANPIISGAAGAAGAGVSTAASNAGQIVTDAAGTAQKGMTGASWDANQKLNPYTDAGSTAAQHLSNLTEAGFSFNPKDLENDPGYQFQLQQGMKGLGNNFAARGLSGSGAALKGAAGYAEGLAGTSYQNAFNRALSTYNANVSSLLPTAQMGLGASTTAGNNLMNAAQYNGTAGMNAAQYAGTAGMQGAEYAGNAGMWGAGEVGSNLVNAGVYQGNTQIGAGKAQASGDLNAASAWNSMFSGIGQGVQNYFDNRSNSGNGNGGFTPYASAKPWGGEPITMTPTVNIPNLPGYVTNAPGATPSWGG